MMLMYDTPIEDLPEGEHMSLSPTFVCPCCGEQTLLMAVENESQEPIAVMKVSKGDALSLVATLVARFDLKPEQIVEAIERCPDNIEALALHQPAH